MHLNIKNRVLLFCFLQAVVVIFMIVNIIVHHPEMLHNNEEVTINPPDATVAGKPDYKRPKKPASNTVNSQDRHSYVVFRFHELKNESAPFSEIPKVWNPRDEHFVLPDQVTLSWFLNQQEYCDGYLVDYGRRVVMLKEVVINPRFGYGKVGGENLNEVMGQSEEEEQFQVRKGFFLLDMECQYSAQHVGDLDLMMKGLLIKEQNTDNKVKRIVGKTAIITIRHDYANFYHTIMNLYDVFLILLTFDLSVNEIDYIWMDAHPLSSMDDFWHVLYKEPIRIGSIQERVTYPTMIWNGFGPYSFINQHSLDELPYVEGFRNFVLTRHDVYEEHTRACGNLKITIIWRRDSVVHPRNEFGFTSRKMANEGEVWRAAKEAIPSAEVNGVQLDKLSMVEQLDLISRTDILIGMHGAGMSHVLFLPTTSGVIELFPQYTSAGNSHFRSMARWRRLPYIAWSNQDKQLESKEHKTRIPKQVLFDMVRTMRSLLCQN